MTEQETRYNITINDLGGSDKVEGVYKDPFTNASWEIRSLEPCLHYVTVVNLKTKRKTDCRITSRRYDKAEDVTFEAQGLSIPLYWKLSGVREPADIDKF